VPQFAYEAVDRTGAITRGMVDAEARPLAVDKLVAGGLTPLSLFERGKGGGGLHLPRLGRSNGVVLVSLISELSTLLNAGLSAERALTILQGLSREKERISLLAAMADRLRSGSTFADAFSTAMPQAPGYIAPLIGAGELSGHLPEVMKRLAANLTRAKALRDRLVSGLTYPALLIVIMIAVLWVMFAAVLPRLKPMFESAGDALPTPTAILLAAGDFFSAYGWLLLIATAAGVVVFVRALRKPAFRLRLDRWLIQSRLMLGLPLQYESARFCRNLQILLSGGLPLDRALAVATNTIGNRWLRERVALARNSVIGGQRLRAALAEADALPPIVAEFAAVGEETGRLAAMMDEAARVLDADVEKRLDRLIALTLPAATLIMGLLVAGIMLGIVSGILAVNDLAL
jgi:general secretion pathway protein F